LGPAFLGALRRFNGRFGCTACCLSLLRVLPRVLPNF